MSDRTRLARKSTVRECQALLAIEPILVPPDEDLVHVMRYASARPATRLIGVVDPDTGRLLGVLPILRVAEGVVARVVPEALMKDLSAIDDIARFGHQVDERTAGEAMIEPATIGPDANLIDAFRTMHHRHLSGLYVVDDEGRPTGYLDLLELATRYAEALDDEPLPARGMVEPNVPTDDHPPTDDDSPTDDPTPAARD